MSLQVAIDYAYSVPDIASMAVKTCSKAIFSTLLRAWEKSMLFTTHFSVVGWS